MVLAAERPQAALRTRVKLAQLPHELRDTFFSAWNYTPTPKQAEIISDDHLSVLVSGGYRSGKSLSTSIKALTNTLAFLGQYPREAGGRVAWLIGADYERCRAEFDYLVEKLSVLPQFTGKITKRIDPGQIEIPTITNRPFIIKTKSASDPASINMEAPIWALACEAAHFDQDIYFRLQSRMVEARTKFPGYGLLILSGTAEHSLGWYPTLYQTWQSPVYQEMHNVVSFSMPSHSNTALFPDGEESTELLARKAELPPELYSIRHLGIPQPPQGRVHTLFDVTQHVQKLKYKPDLPVYLGVDPGYSGQPSYYVVEVAQKQENGQWWIVDEIRAKGLTADQVIDEATRRSWWANPHKTGVIDVAGSTHAGAMESNVEMWFRKTGLVLLNQPVKIMAGIDRFNSMLTINPQTKEPNMVIDQSCRLLISELGGCPDPFTGDTRVYSWHENREGNVVGKTPKDAANDAVKSLSYMFYSILGPTNTMHDRKTIRVVRRNRR